MTGGRATRASLRHPAAGGRIGLGCTASCLSRASRRPSSPVPAPLPWADGTRQLR